MEPENKKSNIPSKKEVRKLLGPFVFLFLVNFLIINWNNVSWAFNYKVVSGIASNFLDKIFNNKAELGHEEGSDYFDKENSIEIPKIGISAPLIIAEDQNEKNLDDELDKGVALFPTSALPDQAGRIIILGHSAPPNWPKIKYDWIFSRLNELEKGDEINLYFNHQKYTYYVSKKTFLQKGGEIPNNIASSENTLLLVSCWPPGKNLKRIIVESTLIKT
jgi:LPXTG-site transpeptidase (sortase) family protein